MPRKSPVTSDFSWVDFFTYYFCNGCNCDRSLRKFSLSVTPSPSMAFARYKSAHLADYNTARDAFMADCDWSAPALVSRYMSIADSSDVPYADRIRALDRVMSYSMRVAPPVSAPVVRIEVVGSDSTGGVIDSDSI